MTVGELIKILRRYDKKAVIDIQYADERTPWRMYHGQFNDMIEDYGQDSDYKIYKKLIITLAGVEDDG